MFDVAANMRKLEVGTSKFGETSLANVGPNLRNVRRLFLIGCASLQPADVVLGYCSNKYQLKKFILLLVYSINA
jgi:hypothetical protein